MTDDLVKRLREDQPVTQDMASTMQCALQDEAADRIEALTEERDSLLAGHRALNIGGARLQDRAETAEAKLAKAVGLLVAWVELSEHCSIEEGVCCCGDNMENHTNPMDCGHMPLDHGTYIAGQLEESTRATLAEIKGGNDAKSNL